MTQAPPPFNPPARKNSSTKVLLAVLFFVVVPCIVLIVVAAVLMKGALNVINESVMPTAECAINYEVMRNSLMDYAKEHDNQLPDAAKWMDEVRPYFAKAKFPEVKGLITLKKMDPNGDWGCRLSETEMSGMAFNIALSKKKLTDIAAGDNPILLFEIEKPRKNAAEEYKARPKETSPRIFGEHRDWLTISLRGDPNIKISESGKIETGTKP